MDEIRNQSIKLFSEWLDKQTNFTTSIKIVCGQGFESIYDDYISRFISRRPELDEEELIPFLLTLRTFYNKDGDVDLTAISKAICAKFTAPEAIKSCKCRNDQEGAMTVKRLDNGLFQCPRCGGIIVGKTEAKQREVKWPEKVDLTGFKDGYGKGSRDHIIAAAWNQAIDACKKAYEESI